MMTKEIFEETLRILMRRRPFQPFTVVLVNGRHIEVDAPESVAWGGGRAAYLNAEGIPTFFQVGEVVRFNDAAEKASA